ncbi:MAG: hypothetical protein KJ698_13110 [Actinobacteria bacterium]|nr:hypothetical protein [Actinomycetota bacterium]MBU1494171.1 hypothetical protein [Actinomycetota bacterium]
MAAVTTMPVEQTTAFEAKIDALTEQVHYLAAVARDAELRRAQWDDLRSEMTPVIGEAFQLVSHELDDVRDFLQPTDLWRLAKRIARNTELIEKMFDQLEGLSELTSDVAPLGRDMFLIVMTKLDELERKGYFSLAGAGMGVLDRVVSSFSEEDVNQLGDNIVLILNTVKEMTQPEVMQLLQRTAAGVREAEVEEIGLLKLMWRMRNPAVRRGMSRMLKVLESFADATPATLGDLDNDDQTNDNVA